MACKHNVGWCPTIFGVRCVKCKAEESTATTTSLGASVPPPSLSPPLVRGTAPVHPPAPNPVVPQRRPEPRPRPLPNPTVPLRAQALVAPGGQTVYRGDTRSRATLDADFGGVFAAWVPLDLAQAREFVTATGLNTLRTVSFFDQIESGRICVPESAWDNWSPGACMEWKIRSGSGNRRMCILSCEMTSACGGYANGYIYTMHFPALRAVPWRTAIPGCTVPDRGTTPLLLMDAATVATATIMAIKSPNMVYTKEIAFFTSVPTNSITDVRAV